MSELSTKEVKSVTTKPKTVPVVILVKEDLELITAPGHASIRPILDEEVEWYAAGLKAKLTVRFDKGDGSPFLETAFEIGRGGTRSGPALVDNGVFRYSITAVLEGGQELRIDPEVEVDGGSRTDPNQSPDG